MQRASRFVESLLLGLPVPGIFLSKERASNKLLVIDGQQRLRTLQYFYEGVFADSGKEFALRAVQDQFAGLTYRKLEADDRRQLDDSILHATIVQQDEPSDDQSSIYYIFERLNTGGVSLVPQEIRAALYHGPFNDLLKRLNGNQAWRDIYGPVSQSMRDQELILRFLAMLFDRDRYHWPLKTFLNEFMGRHRYLKDGTDGVFASAFERTIGSVNSSLEKRAFRPRGSFNAAVYDAVMVGLATRLEKNPRIDSGKTAQLYEQLITRPDFVEATEAATQRPERVNSRISLAIETFAQL
jgi:hypothetical protein